LNIELQNIHSNTLGPEWTMTGELTTVVGRLMVTVDDLVVVTAGRLIVTVLDGAAARLPPNDELELKDDLDELKDEREELNPPPRLPPKDPAIASNAKSNANKNNTLFICLPL
jgi:hypothetical protein